MKKCWFTSKHKVKAIRKLIQITAFPALIDGLYYKINTRHLSLSVTESLQKAPASCWNWSFLTWWMKILWWTNGSRLPLPSSLEWLPCWPNLVRRLPRSLAPGFFVFTQVWTLTLSWSFRTYLVLAKSYFSIKYLYVMDAIFFPWNSESWN